MPGLRHPYEWGRDHPLVVDALVTLFATTLGLVSLEAPAEEEWMRQPDELAVVLTVAAGIPLLLRRRRPLASYLVVMVLAFAFFSAEYSGGGGFFALLASLYAVGAYCRRRTAVILLVTTLGLLAVGIALGPEEIKLTDILATLGMFLTAWVLGDSMRIRRAYVAAVEERAAQLEREQDAQAERAVLEERSRIARELHDVVAHSMSVMVVQAGGARRILDRDPGRAAEAIGQIESTGRGALEEMRRLVGVLRAGGAQGPPQRDAPRLPQPDIDQLPGLIEHCREAGLDVTLRMEGRVRPLPSGVELVVYRVVQEALTNTMQHAGPARAEVELDFGEDAISLEVHDDGRGAAVNGQDLAVGQSAPGHGLAGMRERVALYGGTVVAGPRAGGGFRVAAEIPLAGAEAERSRT